MQAHIVNTATGTVLTVRPEAGPAIVAHVPAQLSGEGSPFNASAGPVTAALATLAAQINRADERYTPAARADKLRAVAAQSVGPVLRKLLDAGRSEQDALNAADARMREIPAGNMHLRSELRQNFRSMTIPKQAEIAARGDFEFLAAVMEAGREAFPNLPAEIFNVIDRRFIIAAHIKRTGLQADHFKSGTADRPLATGPDTEAANRAAELALHNHELRREEVAMLEDSVRSIINVVAGTTEVTRDIAFELLTVAK